jgi:hypothetical protein
VFSKALEQFAVTGGYGTSPNFVYSGTDGTGNEFQILEILDGGIPARPFADGLDGHSWWPLFKAVPTEYLKKYYPLRILRYEARIDSAASVAADAFDFGPLPGREELARRIADERRDFDAWIAAESRAAPGPAPA